MNAKEARNQALNFKKISIEELQNKLYLKLKEGIQEAAKRGFFTHSFDGDSNDSNDTRDYWNWEVFSYVINLLVSDGFAVTLYMDGYKYYNNDNGSIVKDSMVYEFKPKNKFIVYW